MRMIHVRGEEGERYPEDVSRIIKILRDRGFLCTREQAGLLWEKYSASMAAGWMILDDDDEIVYTHIRPYFSDGGAAYEVGNSG